MKISIDNNIPTFDGYLGGSGSDYWRINWEDGSTEGGSSGSPVFDDNQRIIGQLRGGYAACSNDENDWYGRLSRSWTGGGTADTRLSDWLTNDTSVMTTNTIAIPHITGPAVACSGNTTFTLNNAPPSGTHSVSWSASSNMQIVSSTHSTITVKQKSGQMGAGSITAMVSNKSSTCSRQATFTFDVQVGRFSPTQMSISGPSQVCPNQYYTYTVNVPGIPQNYNYRWTIPSSWSIIGQFNNEIDVYTSSSTYVSILAEVDNGCGGYSNPVFKYISGGYCGYSASNFSVFPNPPGDFLEVKLLPESIQKVKSRESVEKSGPNEDEEFDISLYNERQEKILSVRSEGKSVKLNTRDLPSGTYFLHIHHREGVIRKQIIIK